MSAIYMQEFHAMLYIFAASLLMLVIVPKALVPSIHRKLPFLFILILFSSCYYGFESVDPEVYALHLMPLSILLASMFEGALAGTATWVAFVVCGIGFVGTDWAANLISNTLIVLLGLAFHYRSFRRSTFATILMFAMSFVGLYLVTYISIAALDGAEQDYGRTVIIVLGTIPSAALMIYTCYRVKNQQQLQEELYNAEKYQMIGQLAASISHEVRNPLTMTSGFLQMMGKPSLGAETLERYRKHAIEGIDNATSIISDYLNYAKPAIEEARAIDVKAEIEALIPWISSLAALSDVTIHMNHHEGEPLFFMGEPKKFQQCLLNLMKNAIEAMPEGGKLTVTTKVDGNHVHIAIADTGVGMSKLQLKRIGTPFFTTKEKGTGLGLMVCVSLIKVMGGHIAFSSKQGQGTVCDIRYPLYERR